MRVHFQHHTPGRWLRFEGKNLLGTHVNVVEDRPPYRSAHFSCVHRSNTEMTILVHAEVGLYVALIQGVVEPEVDRLYDHFQDEDPTETEFVQRWSKDAGNSLLMQAEPLDGIPRTGKHKRPNLNYTVPLADGFMLTDASILRLDLRPGMDLT